MKGAKLIAAIKAAGYRPRSYSGRGMYGKECVGVSLDYAGEIVDLPSFSGVRPPRTDSMGRGIIAYWPEVAWPEGAAE